MTKKRISTTKQLGVTEDVKREIDMLCEMSGMNQPELLDELWKQYKKENPEKWKRVKKMIQMKEGLLSK